MNFQGKRILLTGATRGIGRALCRQLVAEGAVVLAVARSQAGLDALGSEVVAICADLAAERERTALVENLTQEVGPLDGVINNAGVQTETDFLTVSPKDLGLVLQAEVQVNLLAPMFLSAALLPHLARRPEAFILNIGSSLALSPKEVAPIYCATKAGLRSFTKGLRYQAEAGCPHVRVIEGIMALVDTDMTAGRGRGKISPEQAAAEVLDGVKRGKREIWVEKAKMLRVINRIAPGIVARILR